MLRDADGPVRTFEGGGQRARARLRLGIVRPEADVDRARCTSRERTGPTTAGRAAGHRTEAGDRKPELVAVTAQRERRQEVRAVRRSGEIRSLEGTARDRF